MTRSEDSVYSGTDAFMFINHDATRLGTIRSRSHRQDVNKHVQLAHQKSKNLANSKVARKPLQHTPQQLLSGGVGLNDNRNTDEDRSDQVITSLIKTSLPPGRSNQIVQRRMTKLDWTDELPLSAMNSLTRGNSDPFNSLASPFDATANRLLSYNREVMIPSVYCLEMKTITRSLGIVKAWERITTSFEDECDMCAYLAISAASVIRIAPSSDLTRLALKYKNRSSELLRQRLEAKGDKMDLNLYTIVLSLASSELAMGNFEAGMLHTNMLTFLVQHDGGIQKVDPYIKEMILHFDVQFAMLFLRRPSFDVREWAPEPFNPRWFDGLEFDSTSKSSTCPLAFPAVDSSLASPILTSVIYDIRELLAIESYVSTRLAPGDSPIFRWMFLAKHACEAHLLEFCADQIYSPIRTGDRVPEIITSQEAEHDSLLPAFCVASLYWIAMAFGYSKKKVHASSTLLTHLRNILQPSERFVSASNQMENLPNARLRLWILYIGCVAEQVMGVEQQDGDSRDWHTRRFVLHMRCMGLRSSVECRNVLEGFLFADRMHIEERRTYGPTWDTDGSEKVRSSSSETNGVDNHRESNGTENGFEEWLWRINSCFGSIIAW